MHSTEDPVISVVIPAYNRAGLIGRTIATVVAQTFQNIEIIIVDDASTDDTETAVRQIIDPRIKYFQLEHNSGPSVARNTGVERAKGEFVAFLDSDDEWAPKKLELQLEAVRKQDSPEKIVCYTKVLVVQDSCSYLLPTRGMKNGESVGDYVLSDGHGLIHTSSVFLSRDLAAANPFSTEQRVFEDWDFFLRLEEKEAKWVYLDQPLTTWNNDSREDRLCLSKHDGSEWLKEHRHYLSKMARHTFAVNGIVKPLIRSRQKKLYSFKLLFYAFLGNSLPFSEFLTLTTKIFLPAALIARVKALLLRQRMNS